MMTGESSSCRRALSAHMCLCPGTHRESNALGNDIYIVGNTKSFYIGNDEGIQNVSNTFITNTITY